MKEKQTMKGGRIEDLVYISQAIGGKVPFVQGGGGNTSIKIDETHMAIKASGVFLKDMSIDAGYCIIDYKGIRSYLCEPDEDEYLFSQKIMSFAVKPDSRPSIETGFHALLDGMVIHTHSVYANILSCSIEGKSIADKILSGSIWVDYAAPGRELTIIIKDVIKEASDKSKVIFL